MVGYLNKVGESLFNEAGFFGISGRHCGARFTSAYVLFQIPVSECLKQGENGSNHFMNHFDQKMLTD